MQIDDDGRPYNLSISDYLALFGTGRAAETTIGRMQKLVGMPPVGTGHHRLLSMEEVAGLRAVRDAYPRRDFSAWKKLFKMVVDHRDGWVVVLGGTMFHTSSLSDLEPPKAGMWWCLDCAWYHHLIEAHLGVKQ